MPKQQATSRKVEREIAKVKVHDGGVHKPKLPGDGDKTVVKAVAAHLGVDPKDVKVVRPRRETTLRLPAPRYFVDPVWGPFDAHTGGTWMEATIGPLQGGPGMYGAPPANNTPGIMRDLLDGEHNHFGWIAGHLLNDNMGGPGEARNLTPLTTAGNKNHLNTCETLIKNFLGSAYGRTQYNRDDMYYWGVHYRVEVGALRWHATHAALRHVATELRVWAEVVKQHKMTGVVTPAAHDECPVATWFAPIVNQAVDNTGYDQF